MRDATRPRLLADVAAEVLHDRGLLTLNEMLDTGRLLTVDRDVLVAYAKLVGSVWLGPAVSASGAAILEDYFGERLAHDLLVANPDTVPERELRDLEWAYTLMGDGTSAHRFLEILPPEVRREAEGSAGRAWLNRREGILEIARDIAWDRSRFRPAS